MTEKDIDRVWRMMQSIRFCMFSNWDGANLHSRPMGAFVRRDEGAIYFFTDERAHKDDEIRQHPRVCLAFANTRSQKYLSMSGTGEILNDREKIRELWGDPGQGLVENSGESEPSPDQGYTGRGRVLGCSRQRHQRPESCLCARYGRLSEIRRPQEGSALKR
jgi:general stress protein 26